MSVASTSFRRRQSFDVLPCRNFPSSRSSRRLVTLSRPTTSKRARSNPIPSKATKTRGYPHGPATDTAWIEVDDDVEGTYRGVSQVVLHLATE